METQKPPKAIQCYICQREFRLKILSTHISKCRDQFFKEQQKLPEAERIQCPSSPLGFSNILNGQFERGQSVMSQITATLNEEKQESDEEAKAQQFIIDEQQIQDEEKKRSSVKLEGGFELAKCQKCLRTLLPERLEEHEKNCSKRPYTPQRPKNYSKVPSLDFGGETPLTAKFPGVTPPKDVFSPKIQPASPDLIITFANSPDGSITKAAESPPQEEQNIDKIPTFLRQSNSNDLNASDNKKQKKEFKYQLLMPKRNIKQECTSVKSEDLPKISKSKSQSLTPKPSRNKIMKNPSPSPSVKRQTTSTGSPIRQYSTATPIQQEIDTESLDFLIIQKMQIDSSPTMVIKQIPEEIEETEKFVSKIPKILEQKQRRQKGDRQKQREEAKTMPPTPVAPAPPSKPSKSVRRSPKRITPATSLKTAMKDCPHCLRSFNVLTATRHIPMCEKTKNRPKPPIHKLELQKQQTARIQKSPIKKIPFVDEQTQIFEDLIFQASLDIRKQKSDLKFTIMQCKPDVQKRSRTTRAVRNHSPIKQEIEKIINKDLMNIVDKPMMTRKVPEPLPRLQKKKSIFVPNDKPVFKDPMVQCPVCQRKFGPKAAGRHIRFCQDKVQQEEEKKKFLANQMAQNQSVASRQKSVMKTYTKKMPRSKTMTIKEQELLKQYGRNSPTRQGPSESVNNSKHQFNGSRTEKQQNGAQTERNYGKPELKVPKQLMTDQGAKTSRQPPQIRKFSTKLEKPRKNNFQPPWLDQDFFTGGNVDDSGLESLPDLSKMDIASAFSYADPYLLAAEENKKQNSFEKQLKSQITLFQQKMLSAGLIQRPESVQGLTSGNKALQLNYETIAHISQPSSVTSIQNQLNSIPNNQKESDEKKGDLTLSKFCTQCGQKYISDLDRFCGGCGIKRLQEQF